MKRHLRLNNCGLVCIPMPNKTRKLFKTIVMCLLPYGYYCRASNGFPTRCNREVKLIINNCVFLHHLPASPTCHLSDRSCHYCTVSVLADGTELVMICACVNIFDIIRMRKHHAHRRKTVVDDCGNRSLLFY